VPLHFLANKSKPFFIKKQIKTPLTWSSELVTLVHLPRGTE